MAPCIRRFTSLMSKLSVGITLLLHIIPATSPHAFPCATGENSAGDDRPVAGATQHGPDRTGLRDREYDDRQRRLAGKCKGGRIHHLVAALDGLRMRQPFEPCGGRI